MNVRAGKLPLVDSLRAIAALSVLLTHTAVAAGISGNPSSALSPYAQRLDVGVAIFFLISGLLLYRPFVLARLTDRGAPATGPYAWRRFLRIAPAYWLALTITVIWVGTSANALGVFTPSGFPTYYLMMQTYRGQTLSGGLVQGWTLTIEITFYAFLPLYAWVQRRIPARTTRDVLRWEVIGLLALVGISELWKALLLAHGNAHQVVITPALDSLPAFLDQFALGMGLAVLSAWIQLRGSSPRWVVRFDRAPIVSWIFAALAFYLVSKRIGISPRFFAPMGVWQYLGRQWLYAAVALGLLLPAVIGDQTRGLPRRILSWRVLGWLGLISYGIYLWQTTVLAQLSRWNFGADSVIHPYLWWSAGTLVMTVAIAAASYYLLERPVLSLKNLFGRQRTAPGESLAELAPAVPAPPTASATPTARATSHSADSPR
ncbi:MAG TPA: acyltransferase [Solirubrobacteraceae bacterium]